MTAGWLQYLVVFVGSAVLCAFLTPIAMKIAVKSGALDHPGDHKSHKSPMPYLGGMAIVAAFGVAVALAATMSPPASGLDELIIVLGLATGLALVGLVDDLRQLSPLWRVGVEVVAAIVIWLIGSGVAMSTPDSVDLCLTLIWIVGITNAFNLLDNMDGLAAGLAVVTCLTFFTVASTNGQFLVAALSVGLAGCAAGFLRHNFHPAKIFMGDGGALFIGFLIAYLGLKLRFEGGATISALVPVIGCSVAIFDTSLATVSRLIARRSPFKGGQDHLSHRLVKIGLPVPIAVATIYFGATGIGVLTLVISRIDAASAWILTGLIGFTLVASGALLLTVPVYPNSSGRRFSIVEELGDS